MRGSALDGVTLTALLRCPACGSELSARNDALACDSGHAFPVVRGIPRMVIQAWDAPEDLRITSLTEKAFGRQWTQMADDASVTESDLRMHLPAGADVGELVGLVLDAGCGMGRYAALIAALGGRVVGMDLSVAVEKAAALYPTVDFVQADLAAPPFAPGTFDVVYSFGVLHHLPNPTRGFEACSRLVRPGGLLLVWVYAAHGGILHSARRACRRLVSAAPSTLPLITWAAAISIWVVNRLLRKLPYYNDKSIRQVHVDCHDALVAPAESYLTEADCREWLSSIRASDSGFERRGDGSGWILWAHPLQPDAADQGNDDLVTC